MIDFYKQRKKKLQKLQKEKKQKPNEKELSQKKSSSAKKEQKKKREVTIVTKRVIQTPKKQKEQIFFQSDQPSEIKKAGSSIRPSENKVNIYQRSYGQKEVYKNLFELCKSSRKQQKKKNKFKQQQHAYRMSIKRLNYRSRSRTRSRSNSASKYKLQYGQSFKKRRKRNQPLQQTHKSEAPAKRTGRPQQQIKSSQPERIVIVEKRRNKINYLQPLRKLRKLNQLQQQLKDQCQSIRQKHQIQNHRHQEIEPLKVTKFVQKPQPYNEELQNLKNELQKVEETHPKQNYKKNQRTNQPLSQQQKNQNADQPLSKQQIFKEDKQERQDDQDKVQVGPILNSKIYIKEPKIIHPTRRPETIKQKIQPQHPDSCQCNYCYFMENKQKYNLIDYQQEMKKYLTIRKENSKVVFRSLANANKYRKFTFKKYLESERQKQQQQREKKRKEEQQKRKKRKLLKHRKKLYRIHLMDSDRFIFKKNMRQAFKGIYQESLRKLNTFVRLKKKFLQNKFDLQRKVTNYRKKVIKDFEQALINAFDNVSGTIENWIIDLVQLFIE